MRLFEYSEKSLLASIPTMLAFPKVERMHALTSRCMSELPFSYTTCMKPGR